MTTSWNGRRGNALPETALIVSLMLMLTLAAIDLATVGFGQAEADGSAFVGARTLAVANSTSAPVADTAIKGVFPQVQPSTVVIETTTGSYVGAQVTLPGQPIHLLNNVSSPSQQIGHTYETTLGASNPLNSNLNVVSDVPCAVVVLNPSDTSTYASVRIAQIATSSTGGNGTNANFGEFSYHQNTYSGLSLSHGSVQALFPYNASNHITLLQANTNYMADAALSNGIENTMQSWDMTTQTDGVNTYPPADTTCQPVVH